MAPHLLRHWRCAVPVLFSLIVAAPVRAASSPSTSSHGAIIRETTSLFQREDFPALERLAESLWASATRTPDGLWSLDEVYAAFSMPSRATYDYPAAFARCDRWDKAVPGSTLAKTCRGQLLVSWAWAARGGGYANTVTDTGWKLFAERLRQAYDVLESDPALKQRPGYYQVMLTVALGQGWDRPRYDRLVADALRLAPDYETFYFRKAYFLQPKWYGQSETEWLTVADQAAAMTKEKHGEEFYTRVVWATYGPAMVQDDELRRQGVDWARMRQGFEDILRRYPGSVWNQRAYCYYAYAMRDRETTRRLLEQTENKYEPAIWRTPKRFEEAQQWAAADSGRRE